MAVDRDLGVAFARAVDRSGLAGWEATASTGVRGLRLLDESGAFSSFLFTETSPVTFAVLQANVDGRPGASAALADARTRSSIGRFDFVDVDPYGSPLEYLEAAVSATRLGGVLAVTATDMLVLAGAQAKACRLRYGSEPVRGRLGPEGGLRILLRAIAGAAGRGGRSMRPLLSYVGGHHVRAYVELGRDEGRSDPIAVIDAAAWAGPPLGTSGSVGPLWVGPLVDPGVVHRLTVPPTAACPRALGRFLEGLQGDAEVDRPFYYEGNSLAAGLELPSPPPRDVVIDELRRVGHRAARTHVRPEGFRTDAPRAVVEEAARAAADRRQSQNARVRA